MATASSSAARTRSGNATRAARQRIRRGSRWLWPRRVRRADRAESPVLPKVRLVRAEERAVRDHANEERDHDRADAGSDRKLRHESPREICARRRRDQQTDQRNEAMLEDVERREHAANPPAVIRQRLL